MEADIYSNHSDFKEGICVDIETLLEHLSTIKDKKELKKKILIDLMSARSEESSQLIHHLRASTPPNIYEIPSIVCEYFFY
jgi:hypothetical protein